MTSLGSASDGHHAGNGCAASTTPASSSTWRPGKPISSGKTTSELVGLRKDGTEFPLDSSLSSWQTTKGLFFFGILRDITARKNAERALTMKADELARSNQELEQFAYVASHDLQEPLRMVSNFTQLLASRYKDKLDADANEFIGFAVEGAQRMQALIRDLLQLARVSSRPKEFTSVPADRIARDAVANLTGAIEESGAEVVVNLLPDPHLRWFAKLDPGVS